VVKSLRSLGVDAVFGIPGSHDAFLYDALRKSPVRTILATNELHAAFMANGYFRRCGKPGVMVTVAGPGFTNGVTGLAEAFFDSAGLVCIVCKPAGLPGQKFQLQKIDEKEIIRSVSKNGFKIKDGAEIGSFLPECFGLAVSGEPGPVLLEISSSALSQKTPDIGLDGSTPQIWLLPLDKQAFDKAARRIESSRKPLLYLGQGAMPASAAIHELVDLLNIPVLTTTSGRGILSEKHPMCLPCDLMEDTKLLNTLIESSDLVLAAGCKFTHNGAKGFRLKLPKEKLIHVDASPDVLGANYPAHIALCGDAADFFNSLLQRRELFRLREPGWKPVEIAEWRRSLLKNKHKKSFSEPRFEGLRPPTAAAFFTALDDLLPEDSCMVTDSGLHQMMARKYLPVTAPAGLIVPADFQSMGFGIPAGIGAKLASPESKVVIVTGDGGFALSGMELLTAVREKIDVTVILFNDNRLGMIHLHQLSKSGRSHAVQTGLVDYSRFCESIGCACFKAADDCHASLEKALEAEGVSLVEVSLRDSLDYKKSGVKGAIRSFIK